MLGRWCFMLLLTAALAAAPRAASAAPMFNDLPTGHWAQDAVSTLAAQGLLRGYSDGAFKGDRAMTRYEVAEVIDQLLSLDEGQHRQLFASRARTDELRQMLAELQAEVGNNSGRADALDREVHDLQRRLKAARW